MKYPVNIPKIWGEEHKLVSNCLDSGWISSAGEYVNIFEDMLAKLTNREYCTTVSNGTVALEIAIKSLGLKKGDEVILPNFTIISALPTILELGLKPIFIEPTDGFNVCPLKLIEQITNKTKCIIITHIYCFPVDLDPILVEAKKRGIWIIEDSAEMLGQHYKGKPCGSFGDISTFSFFANKIITTGGGGMILCKNKDDGVLAKHITTTAKLKHRYEFFHDQNAYNYRMPNLNAALGCAQFENLDQMLKNKRVLAETYKDFFKTTEVQFFSEPDYALSNYWLNAVFFSDKDSKTRFLQESNDYGIGTRPIWTLMTELPMYKNAFQSDLSNSHWIEERLVCLPSSYCPNLEG